MLSGVISCDIITRKWDNQYFHEAQPSENIQIVSLESDDINDISPEINKYCVYFMLKTNFLNKRAKRYIVYGVKLMT